MRLRDGILDGRPAPAEAPGSELVLAEELGCNRHAVPAFVLLLVVEWISFVIARTRRSSATTRRTPRRA